MAIHVNLHQTQIIERAQASMEAPIMVVRKKTR